MEDSKSRKYTTRKLNPQWLVGPQSGLPSYEVKYTNQWSTCQIDFILTFSQADVDCDMYMEVPREVKVTN